MKKTILFLLFLLYNYPIYSQLEPQWVKRYDNSLLYNSYVTDMYTDNSGHVYITGYINIDSANSDVITIKYNSSGSEEWIRTFDNGVSGKDKGVSIKADDSGYVYVTAETELVNQHPVTKPGTTVLKYSSQGTLIWNKYFINSDSLFTLPKCMAIDDSSNVYVSSDAYVEGQSSNCVTLKYDKNGILKWSTFFDNPFHSIDTPRDIKIDNNRNIYVVGSSYSLTTSSYYLNLIKYNSNGVSQWVFTDTSYFSNKIILDQLQNIYLSSSGGVTLVKKYNQQRELIRKFDYRNSMISPNNLYYRDFILDKNDNPNVACSSVNIGELGFNFLTVKFNSTGDTAWSKQFNPIQNSNDDASSIAIDKLGDCIITGKSNFNLANNKYATIIYTPEGTQKYALTYQGSGLGNHEAIKVLTDTSGNIYVTGKSQNNAGIYGIATIKYSALTRITQIDTEIPDKVQLFQNYPNPFNPTTNIKFNISKASNVKIIVFDVMGREIEKLVDKNISPGGYKVIWNASSISSGVYYYSLFINGNLVSTKQLIFIK